MARSVIKRNGAGEKQKENFRSRMFRAHRYEEQLSYQKIDEDIINHLFTCERRRKSSKTFLIGGGFEIEFAVVSIC